MIYLGTCTSYLCRTNNVLDYLLHRPRLPHPDQSPKTQAVAAKSTKALQ